MSPFSRHPFPSFLTTVVLPCAGVAWAALRVADAAWEDTAMASDTRVARAALASMEQDLGATVDSLLQAAEPLPSPDPGVPTVQRALSGDTITGIVPVGGGFEVSVMYGLALDTTRSEAGARGRVYGVRYASAAFIPSAASGVQRSTGYRVALFLNGARWASGPTAPGPERLGDHLLDDLSRPPFGEAYEVDGAVGALVPMDPEPGRRPTFVALAVPPEPRPDPVSLEVRLVIGLVLLFAGLAGWIQLGGRPRRGADTPSYPSGASVLMLGLVPALAVGTLMIQLDRSYQATVRDALSQDLARGMALATLRHVVDRPQDAKLITGFDATRTVDGVLASTTYSSEPNGLSGLRAPPSSFIATGTMDTPEGPGIYAARRTKDGGVTLLTAPWPGGTVRRFRGRLALMASLLTAWLLMVGAGVVLARRRHPPSGVSSGR